MSRTPNSKTNKRYNKLKSTSKIYSNQKKVSNIFTDGDDKKIISNKNLTTNENSTYLDREDNYYNFFTTSQIRNIDFSKFQNHVFLDSAVNKVSYCFEEIINNFPYDKSFNEKQQYHNKLNGYVKYILKERFPKNLGYLYFDGNQYVKVNDENGRILNDFSGKAAKGNLNFGAFSLNFDFWIKPTNLTNNNQIVLQKIHAPSDLTQEGYSIYISDESGIHYINIVLNSQKSYLKSKHKIKLNEWNHVHILVTKNSIKNSTIIFYINGLKQNENLTEGDFLNELPENGFNNIALEIGKGVDHNNSVISATGGTVSNFIGFLDELKISRKIYNQEEIRYQKNNNINKIKELKLYLKFNEPTGEYTNNNICLDSSGQKLHGIILNIDGSNITQNQVAGIRKEKTSSDLFLKYEKEINNPVLFPGYTPILNLQNELHQVAKRYDIANPNTFWKIIPKSLFEESSNFEQDSILYANEEAFNFSSDESNRDLSISYNKSKELINLLIIWSRFFDEIKLYIDSIKDFNNINYDALNNNESVNFILPIALKNAGFEFKEIFPTEIFEKLENKNLTHDQVLSTKNIRIIQNNLWKRFFINSQDYLRSKGTVKGIKNTFRSFGIDADRFVTVREYHGKNVLNLYDNKYKDSKSINYLNFLLNKDLNKSTTYADNNTELPNNKFVLKIEDFSQDSQGINDGEFNYSKSWSIELVCKFNSFKNNFYNNKQNIFRINRDNSSANLQPVVNLYFSREINNVNYGKIVLEISDNASNALSNPPDQNDLNSWIEKKEETENINFIDGNDYYFCLTKEEKNTNTFCYKLYVYNMSFPYEDEISILEINDYRNNNTFEKSSKYKDISIGNSNNNLNYLYKNNTVLLNPLDSTFEGELSRIRLWSRSLEKEEVLNHSKDINSKGILNPSRLQNQNLNNNLNNSTEYLKLNVDFNFDFEKNNLSSSGVEYDVSNLEKKVIEIINKQNFENIYYKKEVDVKVLDRDSNFICTIESNSNFNTFISELNDIILTKEKLFYKENPKIDEPITYNGININNQESENRNVSYLNNETFSDFVYNSDIRLSIDFSSVKFINEDISNILIVNDYFNKNLGDYSNRYCSKYKSLDSLKKLYFLKLKENIDFKPLYQVFKYFDNILSDLLMESVPTKASYNGFNFVVESCILERSKYQYKMSNSHIQVVDENSQYNDTHLYNKEENSNNKFTTKIFRNFNSSNIQDPS